MRRSSALALVLVPVLGLLSTGCSDEGEPRIQLPTLSLAPTATTTSPAPPDSAAPSGDATVELAEVLGRVEEAGSVRLAVGNLNPPPTQFVVQDLSSPDGDLELRVEVIEGEPVLTLRRVDGKLYLATDDRDFEPVPLPEADDDALAARILRTTPALELRTLLGGVTSVTAAPDAVGQVEGASAAYRLRVVLADLPAPGTDAFASIPWRGLPDRLPATLWIGADGLPARLEARYADPLNGIEGTGTVRIDYTAWDEPVDLAVP